MLSMFRKILGRILPERVKKNLRRTPAPVKIDHRKIGYAQEGEDLILISLFSLDTYQDRVGFYVDIGAHHPLRVSNTHLLYLRGWRGINVDPLPGSMKIFNEHRPGDINLELGISSTARPLPYFKFNEPVFNGFDAEVAKARDGVGGAKIESVVEVPTLPLSQLLEKHLPPGKTIDLLSVDVEGLDLQVLQSNDWERFRPSVIAVEDGELLSLLNPRVSAIVNFLAEKGYAPYCKTPLTTFFAEQSEAYFGPFGMRLARYDKPASAVVEP